MSGQPPHATPVAGATNVAPILHALGVYGLRVDPPEEILAHKLCMLLSRAESRDLVDVHALELAGYRMAEALPAVMMHDSGSNEVVLKSGGVIGSAKHRASLTLSTSVAKAYDSCKAANEYSWSTRDAHHRFPGRAPSAAVPVTPPISLEIPMLSQSPDEIETWFLHIVAVAL